MKPELFEPFLNQRFVLEQADLGIRVDAPLVEVKFYPEAGAVRTISRPFSLLFEVPRAMPQSTYTVHAPDGRTSKIFMTPVRAARPGLHLQAVFN
ncbi:MAG: hypothetical protein JXR37_27410 [Kiritimatiellae bacterium]|nr:hypothetical protein [Kiritimatiellia bacterium]